MIGLFGPKTDSDEVRTEVLELSAEYPSRLRFQNSERLIVRIHNRSDAPLAEVSVAFDAEYIHAFTAVAFDPAPESPYMVDIGELAPGDSRLLSVQITADEYGSHRGWISVSAGGTNARLELSTFVFP